MSRSRKKNYYLIDRFSFKNIKHWETYQRNIESYCWDHYSYLAHQRSLIRNELKISLMKNMIEINFDNWKRAVDCQFNENPLSARGSILSETGGRFNIGNIDEFKFPIFAGLYLAEDTTTALSEKYGLEPKEKRGGLTAKEINLAGNVSIYNVSGKIHNVIDISNNNLLYDFFAQIQNIILPEKFIKRAKLLKINPMLPVLNIKQLRNTLLEKNWRLLPMQFNIPSNSQIFGQITYSAGIEGILYPSVKTQKNCLVIYPNNLKNTNSFVKIDGKVSTNLENRKLDSNSYLQFI